MLLSSLSDKIFENLGPEELAQCEQASSHLLPGIIFKKSISKIIKPFLHH